MTASGTITEQQVLDLLDRVKDPEIPVISVVELGVIQNVHLLENGVQVDITPTYTGCPAMDVMKQDIEKVLHEASLGQVIVKTVMSPAWSTDRISDAAKEKLRKYGIAPPGRTSDKRALTGDAPIVHCPQCGSDDTLMVSAFGSTACKSLYKCRSCLEPFDHFKCI